MADYSKEIGHQLKSSGGMDQVKNGGFKGKYLASHAEKKMAINSPNQPIGVSKPMCRDCKEFFKKHAQYQGKDQIVTDTKVTRIFHPDGNVTKILKVK